VFSHELPREFTAKLLYRWGGKNTKKKGKKDRMKIEVNGKIPQDKET